MTHPLEPVRKLKKRFAAEMEEIGLEVIAFGVGLDDSDTAMGTAMLRINPDALQDPEQRKVNKEFEALMAGQVLDDVNPEADGKLDELKTALEEWDNDE
jgi:hypothetical protein